MNHCPLKARRLALLVGTASLLLGTAAQAENQPSPFGAGYLPYPISELPNQVFFGDTHLHTTLSTDAGMVGNRLGPEDAYRFARGEHVTSSTGSKARLDRPLDFLVVADHAENLGLPVAIKDSDPALLANPWGKQNHDLVKQGTLNSITAAYMNWQQVMATRDDPLKAETGIARGAWQRIMDAAEQYNAPGVFTSFIAFEWTSAPGGNNLHRNVIFRDGKDKATQVVPLSTYDTQDPEQLWQWMAAYEAKTGGKMLAIPHNGNLSNGLMFDAVTLSGKPLDRDYAERRARWEPLYEVTQMKGDGEAHPLLSPNDEFANFERWDRGSFGAQPKTPDMLPREYAREALKSGLLLEQQLGVNPFKFGLIGSTDSHTSLSTSREDNFFGKVTPLEPSKTPIRFDEIIAGRPGPDSARMRAMETSASGLAAVWARENTREAIWDAMARKEVYATTGTRMRVRLFAGWDFQQSDLARDDFAAHGYATGVPMGGDLRTAPAGKAPTLLVQALRDPLGANLDRVQLVKGWLDAAGKPQEKVYDLAWSAADKRQPDADGKLPAVGNTVDVEQASYSNDIGATELAGFWRDPDFDPAQRAFYYVRVLEIPTPRWTTYDAKFFGVKRPEHVPTSIQERAYTSPIWYSPQG